MIDTRPAGFLVGSHPLELAIAGRERPSRTAIALSPDGRTIAFTARRDESQSLYIRPFDQDRARPLSGTDGAGQPFFSPDGEWVGFWSVDSLKKAALAGGPPVRLVETGLPMGASWTEDDRVVFERQTMIWSVPASGGAATQLTKRPADGTEARHVSPQILPGGRWLVYTVLPIEFGWDQARVVAQSLETGERKTLIESASDARYVTTGHLVYMRLGNLMMAPFDLDKMALVGGETGVVEGVMQAVNAGAIPIDTGAGHYAVSAAGTLAYVAGEMFPDFEGALVWILRNGSIEPVAGPPPSRPYFAPRLSPDGQSLAVGTLSLHDQSLWRYDLSNRTLTRLTTTGRVEHPLWSHDGRRITIGLSEKGSTTCFR